MYKLVAIDLDDTLLNDENRITDATKASLAAAIERGTVVTLATGRMYASASAIARDLNWNVPLITYQGALVKTAIDGEVLYQRNVPENVALGILDYCTANGLYIQGYVDDQLYVSEENEKSRYYTQLSKIPYIVEPDFKKIIHKPQAKMLIIDEPARLDEVAEDLKRMFGDSAHITKSKPNFLEIMHPEGTKGSALRFLAAHFGCAIEETIAIGDSWNDHDMIEAAGLGVAMANAVEPLKQVADFITKSNNEDGVKYVVDRFILNEEVS